MPKNDGFWHFAEKNERWPSLFLADSDSTLNSGPGQQASKFLEPLLVFVYRAWKEITLKNVLYCGDFAVLIRFGCAFFYSEAKIKPIKTAKTDNHRSRRDQFFLLLLKIRKDVLTRMGYHVESENTGRFTGRRNCNEGTSWVALWQL